MVALAEHLRRFLARGSAPSDRRQGHIHVPTEGSNARPCGWWRHQRAADPVRLHEVAQNLAAIVQPGQQVEGNQDTAR
jgi:hypothetical protein